MDSSRSFLRLSLAVLLLGNSAFAANPPLVHVTFSPAAPLQGQTVSAFIQLISPFDSAAPVNDLLDANVDAAEVPLLHPSQNLWIADLGPYSEIATHKLSVAVSLQDAQQAKSLQDQITQMDQQISELRDQIAAEHDPNTLATLKAELERDQTERAQLAQALAATAKPVGTDTFSFSVAANMNPAFGFPEIDAVSPNYGPALASNVVSIAGKNFSSNAAVFVGGKQATVTQSSPTQLTVSIPAPGTSGAEDVEVRNPGASGTYSNAILSAGYYVLPASVNMDPVAVISAPLYAPINQAATIDGSGSYGQLDGSTTYNWSIQTEPPNSKATLVQSAAPSSAVLTPDLIGTYQVKLTVTSSGTTSPPVIATLIAYQPGSLQVSTSLTGFAARVGQAQHATVTLSNSSNLDTVTVTSVSLNGDIHGEFSGLPSGEFTLGPGQSQSFTLTYTPVAASVAPAPTNPPGLPPGALENLSLSVSGTSTSADGTTLHLSPQPIQLTATAYEQFPLSIRTYYETTAPTAAVAGTEWDLDSTHGLDVPVVIDEADSATVYVTNTSSHPVPIANPPSLSPNSGALDFSLDTSKLPSVLAAGQTALFTVNVSPVTPSYQIAVEQVRTLTWNLDLAPAVDSPYTFNVFCKRLDSPGIVLGDPVSATQDKYPSPTGPFSNMFLGLFADSVNPSFVNLGQYWLFRITDFEITGPDAQYFTISPAQNAFTPVTVPGTSSPPFLVGADFGNFVPLNPPGSPNPVDAEQISFHFFLNFNPPATGHLSTYIAKIQLKMDGLKDQLILPFSATASARGPMEINVPVGLE